MSRILSENTMMLARQITQLSKRMQDIESQMHGISGSMQSFSKLGEHAATCQPSEMKSELQSLKADMIDLAHKFEAMREMHATGRFATPSAKLTKEDYERVAEARITDAPLAEIVAFTKGEKYEDGNLGWFGAMNDATVREPIADKNAVRLVRPGFNMVR